MGRIAANTIVDSDINADANIVRSKMIKETVNHYLELEKARIWDAPQTLLSNVASADDLAISNGGTGYGTDQIIISTSDATDTTLTQYCRFPFERLRFEYVAGEAIVLRLRARVLTIGSVTNQIDCNVNAIGLDGTVGGDLITTSAQTVTASYANYDFAMSSTGLTVNTPLDIRIFFNLEDGATTGGVYGELAAAILRLPVRG